MTHTRWIASLTASLSLATAGAMAQTPSPQPNGPTQYIVDYVMTGAPIPMTLHISRSDANQRIDMDMPTMNPQAMQMYACTTSTVVRPDLKKVFILTHYKKEYQEKDLPAKTDMTDPRSEAGKIEELGSETIDGDECTKYRLTMDQGSMLMWVTKKNNMMRKIQQEGNAQFAMEAKNLQLTNPPASTFEIPQDFKKVSAGPSSSNVAKGIFTGIATGIASSFLPNFAGGMAGMAQARAMQQQVSQDAEQMTKGCKPMDMSGMMGRGRGRGME